MNQETVKLNNLRIAPRKVRLIAALLRGLPVSEAEAQLLLRPQRAARPLLKLLRSAIANALHNNKLDAGKLFIKNVMVNQGTMLKRFMPRAQGRAAPIHKKMSHVVLTIEEAAKPLVKRFTIVPPKREKKEKLKAKTQKPKITAKMTEKPKEKIGFFRRFFRRKSV